MKTYFEAQSGAVLVNLGQGLDLASYPRYLECSPLLSLALCGSRVKTDAHLLLLGVV